VYHHASQQHLKRYLTEFDFSYSHRAAVGVDDTNGLSVHSVLSLESG
jgi:hypothetical protein